MVFNIIEDLRNHFHPNLSSAQTSNKTNVGSQQILIASPGWTTFNTPQKITFIGGIKDQTEIINFNQTNRRQFYRKFTKLFFDSYTNTINRQVVIEQSLVFPSFPLQYSIPISLDIPLAKNKGDTFTLKVPCVIKVYFYKAPGDQNEANKAVRIKTFKLKPATYTLDTQGLLPSLPQVGYISNVRLKSIEGVPVGIVEYNPSLYTSTYLGNVTSNYFSIP